MTLFGIRVFAEVIKVKVWIRSYGIKVVPKSSESILAEDEKGHHEAKGRSLAESGGRSAQHGNPEDARREAWDAVSLRKNQPY